MSTRPKLAYQTLSDRNLRRIFEGKKIPTENRRWAKSGAAAIRACNGPKSLRNNELHDMVVDTLANIHHLCHVLGEDFDACAHTARSHVGVEGVTVQEEFQQCERCGGKLSAGFCSDQTCPFSDHLQTCASSTGTGGECTCGGRITAEVHSDDHDHEVSFTANPWFTQATDNEIRELAQCDWGGDQPADQVALGLEDQNPDIAALMQHCQNNQDRRDPVGFECHVDKDSAVKWLKVHRPELLIALAIEAA